MESILTGEKINYLYRKLESVHLLLASFREKKKDAMGKKLHSDSSVLKDILESQRLLGWCQRSPPPVPTSLGFLHNVRLFAIESHLVFPHCPSHTVFSYLLLHPWVNGMGSLGCLLCIATFFIQC